MITIGDREWNRAGSSDGTQALTFAHRCRFSAAACTAAYFAPLLWDVRLVLAVPVWVAAWAAGLSQRLMLALRHWLQ